MKRNILASGVIASLVLGLTACGSGTQTTTGTATQSNSAGAANNSSSNATVVELTDEEAALAEELLDRYVTADDNITKGVIEKEIELLKERYEFEKLDTLKIQKHNWVYVSQGEGWFEDLFGDNNTKVECVEGSIGNETQLMARGELHLANRMLYPYLLYKSQGADLTALAISADPDADIVSILVKADSPYQTFDDLKGKTIGSWNAGCQYVALVELTEDRGWEIGTDWTYENISNDSLKAALQAGEIDAISVHPLTSFNGSIIDGSFREISYAKEDGTYVNYGGASVTFTYPSFAEENENILRAALKLRELVSAYIILNEEETSAVVETVTRTPVENSIFWNERSAETFYNSQQSLEELISDTDNYQNWLISHVDDFTEENRVDSSSYFNAKFFD